MDSFEELDVSVVPFFDPFRKSGQALPVDSVDAFICLFITEVVANLVACAGPSFGNIKDGGVALDLADLLASGASADNCIPSELPNITIGLQAPSPSKEVPEGGDCGI